MKHTGDYELDEINMLEQECQDLEEDNKRLEQENRKLKENIAWYEKEEDRLTKEISSYINKNHILYRNCEDLNNENKFLREENKKLKSEIENMKKVGRENIETLDKMSIELENYSESFKRYRDFSKQELADSLYDSEKQNKKLKERVEELEKEIEELNKMMLFETKI